MFFQKKFITIFENENFKVEIENKFNEIADIIRVLNVFIRDELEKEDSEVILMLTFLKKIQILISDHPHIMLNDLGKIYLLPSLSIDFIDTFKHELVHTYEASLSQFEQFYKKKYLRFHREGFFSRFFKKEYLQRKNILFFFKIMISEGFANYLERSDRFHKINQNHHLLYAEAVSPVLSLKKSILDIKNLNSDYSFLYGSKNSNHAAYLIGEHIIDTILHSKTKISFLDLIEKQEEEILKLYEEVMINELKLQPLITYSSGKGILDYKQTIREWHELRKKEKK